MQEPEEKVDKGQKYDRQLRLWGDHGQSALESASVCLINATATGTEILKNIILPGVGSFTIIDEEKVTGEDAGNNFFLTKADIGSNRGAAARAYLQELNDDVHGYNVEESVADILQCNSTLLTQFSLVVACDLSERTTLHLAEFLHRNSVSFVLCKSYGFIGYMRICTAEHTIIESHPDSVHEDLRLDRPLPEFAAFCDSLDLATMSSKDHSHTPWLVLLHKFLNVWREQHNGQMPKNYKEKQQFKELLSQGVRRNEEGVPEDEENFDEAARNVNTSLLPSRIPDDVKSLLNDPQCSGITAESSLFWILVRALKEFIHEEGCGLLPLRGSIPDMTSDSERFIRLQTIYRTRAQTDAQCVYAHALRLLASVGKSQDYVTEKDVKTFCRNAAFLRVVRTRSIAEEYDPKTAKTDEIGAHVPAEEDGDDDGLHYVMLRAVQRFQEQYGRCPGDQELEGDIPKLKSCVVKLLHEWSLPNNVRDDLIQEYCRYGGAELHSVAAYMGGVAAQEVIKLLTHQFVPVNNTFIYNGMKQTSITMQL